MSHPIGESSNGRTPVSGTGNEGSTPSSPAKVKNNLAGIPHYIESLYRDILDKRLTVDELGCAIFKDGKSFALNERITFESWAFYGNIPRVISIQHFIDIMSTKIRINKSWLKRKDENEDQG